MTTPAQTPRVATGQLVFDERMRLLTLVRVPTAATGGGQTAIPGGKLDAGESLLDGARRELFEETGVEAHAMRRLSVVTEDRVWGPTQHFVTHYFVATAWSGTPTLREPHKHLSVDWTDVDALRLAVEPDATPSPTIFDPLAHLLLDGGLDEAIAIVRAERSRHTTR